MSEKKAQLEISANSAPAEQAFERIQSSGKAMADGVTKSGEQVDKALKGIEKSIKDTGKEFEDFGKKGGDGFKEISKEAKPAADGVDKATKSMIASVQRTTAALHAGEKGTAKYFETLASQRGVDVSALQPYIDQLKRVEAAQTKTGISAAQTAAALRGVPAQFTDIATSLQGGQAPLTVFLQQGGQLKDMFGGAGNAAKALGGYVASLVNPLTVAAAAAGALAVAYSQGAKEADAFRAALVTTGNAAGTSTNQLAAMAAAMDQSFGTTAGKAAEVLAQLAATGQVGRASLQDFSETAIQAEKAFGTATKDIAKNFADLGKDPVGASARLDESMNYLTASTYKQIQAAMDLGQESKAAALAQDAYNSALKGRSTEMLASMGYIERGWGGIKSAAKEAWDAMLGVGRTTTVDSKLYLAQRQLEDTLKRQEQFGKGSFLSGLLDGEVTKLREQIAGYAEIERLQKRAGDSAVERKAKEQADIEMQKKGLEYRSTDLKMQTDINQQVAAMRKAGWDEVRIQERIAQIKASYDKKGSKAQEITEYEKLNKRIGEFAALQTAALEADAKLTEGQRLAVKVKQDMAAAGAKLSVGEKQRLQTTLDAALATEQRVAAEKDLAKFMDEASKVQAKAADQADKAIENLKQQAAAEREATAAIGLGKDAIAELTAAKYDDSAAGKERLANTMAEAGESELLVQKYRAEAAALRDLAKAKRERGAAEAATEAEKIATKAAEKAASDWQRAAEKIENSLTDALMRGFENGKSFAQNLRDVLVNTFKTMVLRPAIQGVVSLGMGAAGLMGPGMAQASGTTGLSTVGNAFSLYSAGNTAFTLGSQLSAGTMSAANVGATVYGNTAAAAYGGSMEAMLAANGAFGTAGAGAAAGGSSMMASAAAAGPYVAAAVLALNALGAFRSTKTVGGGLVGTLGAGDVQSYDLQRKGGTLFGGPSYSVQGLQATDQTTALESAFVALRKSTAQMAKDLGLSTAQVDQFTMAVGDVKVHPDIDRLGLVLDGLSDAERLQKINDLLQKSADGMAQVVLGAGATAQQLAQLYASVMQERTGLEGQLLQLQGDTIEIRRREREALHESNRALYDQIKALEDSKSAAQAAAQALEQRNGLQDQLDELLGNTAALRERERSGIDASNLALYDQIQALKAYATSLKSAQSALATATIAVTSAQQNVSAIQQQGTAGYISALQAVQSIQDQIAQQALQTAQTYRDLGKQLREYVTGIVTPPSDSFAKALTKALGGDREAMASLPGLATSASDQVRNSARTREDFDASQARILSGVLEAAAEAQRLGIETPAQAAQTLQQQLLAAQNKLAEALATANAINAPLVQTQASLVGQYQAALTQLTDAQSWAKRTQDTLDAIKMAAIAGNDVTHALWASLIQGFDKMDATQDGLLSSNEFFIGMAGKATDKELQDLFFLLDNNGDGQLSKLEAIATNTAVMAAKIGQGTSSAINTAVSTTPSTTGGSTQEMTQAAFTAALQSEAVKQGLSASAVTSSFSSGLFAQLDANRSGGLSSSESSATTITSAIQNLLASTTAAQAVTLTAKDLQILSSGAMKPVNTGSGEAGSVVFDLFKKHLGRRPELDGYNFWTQTYASIKAASDSANAFSEVEKAIKFAAESAGGVPGVKKHVADYFIGLGGTQAGADEAVKRLFFATGGAFANGVVTRPTDFAIGKMGEAGPEAIMPLANIDGSLGIRAQMPGTQDMLQALQAMQVLMQRLQTVGETSALTSQEHLHLVRRMTRDGRAMPVAPSVNDPLSVKVIT